MKSPKATVKATLLYLPQWRVFDVLIALIYFYVAHRRLPKHNSGLLNDYLFYLKISPVLDSPLRQVVSDKELVKIFYRGVFLADVAPKTLAKAETFAEFEHLELPEKCVIKPTHLTGCIYYNRAKRGLDESQREKVSRWFRTNMYNNVSRERNYRTLRPMVICEEVIASSEDIKDYKVFCYKGKARIIQVDVGRHTSHKQRFYTTGWNALDIVYISPLAAVEKEPSLLNIMLSMANEVAKYFEFIRIDFYLTVDCVFIGEVTNVPNNAHGRFACREDERKFMAIMAGANDS